MRARPEQLAPLREWLAGVIRTLPDHSLLDRIVRGRTWILLLGVMLAGIVAMQVELLKLNASIGRSLQLGAALQSRNDLLRASVSSLSDAQRIERLATGMGMVMAGPTSVQFVGGRPVDPGKAAANIHTPDPGTFQSALQSMLASATASSAQGGASSAATGPAAAASGPSSAATGTTAAPATASPGAATSSRATAPTSQAPQTLTPTRGATTPTGAATPRGGAATPAGGAAAPTGGPAAPSGGAATATGASVTPRANSSPAPNG